MARFRVETKSLSTLAATYAHDPESFTMSIADYIEDMFGQGWEYVNSEEDGNGYRYFFKANAQ